MARRPDRDQVRHGHWRGTAMQRPGARLRVTIGHGHALMLAQVLDPRLREEGFDVTVWIGRVMEQLPAHGAVPEAFQTHLPHGPREVSSVYRVDAILHGDQHRTLLCGRFDDDGRLGPV